MKNKKGFIHTLEATIAVLIILTLILVLIPKEEKQEIKTPLKLQQAYKTIFTEIELNLTFRDCILKLSRFGKLDNILNPCIQNSELVDFITKNVPPRYNHLAEVCETSTTCIPNLYPQHLPVDKDVYTDSTLIASQPSRIVRIYFWEK